MMKSFSSTRRLATFSLVALSLGLAACSDDADDVEVEFMRITVGAQQVLVNGTGAVTGSITIPNGVATPVSVEFLNGMMADALGDSASDFQVTVTPGNGLTFVRTGPFSGTLTGMLNGSLVGPRVASFALLHIEENHEDFGPFTVNITVSPALLR